MARPRCVYCGAELPSEAVISTERGAGAEAATRSTPSTRTLLVVDWSAAPPGARAGAAVDLDPFEEALRRRRGGYGLERILEGAAADEEAARLRAAGLRVFLVPESVARREPWLAASGAWDGDGLRLRGEGGVRSVSRADLLLVVRGPILREYQAKAVRRKIEAAGLDGGYRFHLHLKAGTSPLELDPGEFDFRESERASTSSLLEMSAWVEGLAAGVPIDDGFRFLTPALGPASPAPGAALRPGTLTRDFARRSSDEPTVLDNVGQFRFYSGWRAAVERQRLG